MTAKEAKTFDRFSEMNVLILTLGCNTCIPYEDWFTYARWKAQGFQVQRGKKGTKIDVVKTYQKENEETGRSETKTYMGTASVFCRHQVKEIK